MPDSRITLRKLKRILAKYGVEVESSGGKGSHIKFFKQFDDGRYSYPVPTHGKDVKSCYVAGCRKKFRLTPDDGVSDDEF